MFDLKVIKMKKNAAPRLAMWPEIKLMQQCSYNGIEVTQLARGRLRTPDRLVNGVLVMSFGRRYVAVHDVAWAKTYGNWPLFTLWHRDGNARNCALENLLPCRVLRRRFRYFADRHPLSERLFATADEARIDWLRCFASELEADMGYCLNLEREARGEDKRAYDSAERPAVSVYVEPAVVLLDTYVSTDKPKRVPKSMIAYQRGEVWVVVNRPSGVWDDMNLRIDAALGKFVPEISRGGGARIITCTIPRAQRYKA